MKRLLTCLLLFLILGSLSETRAEGFEFGFGLGFADSGSMGTFDGGWDVQFGYEMKSTDNWNFGTQLHFLQGWTSVSDVDEEKALGVTDSTMMAFDSQALYLTARPENWWLEFRVGGVHARYYTVEKDASSFGAAAGISLVTPSDTIRLHILDFNRYQVGGESFNVYSVSIVILTAPWFL